MVVKKACDRAFYIQLLAEKCKLSKGKEIRYDNFQVQPYLRSESKLSSEESCKILKCRIRDLDVRDNFPNAYADRSCPFPQCESPESQLHLSTCQYYSDSSVIPNGLKYEDLFESDIEKQFQVMSILMKRVSIRNKLFPAHTSSRGWPVDPRKEERLISRDTSRQSLSLVIRRRRNKDKKTVKYRQKSKSVKNN